MALRNANGESRTFRWAWRLSALAAFGSWIALLLLPSPMETPEPPYLDLSGCTHIEIDYGSPVLEHFFPKEADRDLLSAEEVEYLGSLRTVVVSDEQRIATFARDLVRPHFVDEPRGGKNPFRIICRQGSETLASFTAVEGGFPVAQRYAVLRGVHDGRCFRYSCGPTSPLLAPELRAYAVRQTCAYHLSVIASWSGSHAVVEETPAPPDRWCDRFTDPRQSELAGVYGADYAGRFLECPGAEEGRCHYAINPSCTAESPEDTVFLFETRAGWNQLGGPELFSFDNHDPEGGCVLLNDGTIKFIRTEEELHQLHWK